ncbi:hypothetical protein IQ247_29345 [Plectonema cf. radiosum LEGE 06105]|uniref:SD-repeat containing protein B domain-containing protein n=1 Tax=Plectonema cf. radiosum LEGE 06105 TaxID=945769 RepID=A0A8J7F564_9CYAN|nr:SdrD B-like domain-containing protein [Plectonema radiosum]MBE9216711.1 hypothetical protein [Plectonema cf. radiosum LEGE 06105]
MKSLFKNNTTKSKIPKLGLGAGVCIVSAITIATTSPVNAQVAITSLDATYQTGTSSSYDTTVANPCSPGNYPGGCDSNINMQFGVGTSNDLKLSGFKVGTQSYSLIQLADSVAFRRVNGQGATGERQLVFFEYNTNNQIKSSYTNTMAEAMLSTIINRGIDNAFSNDNSTASNNIERIDYIISAGLAVPSANLGDIGFLILERGGNDPFKIAAITSLDANGKPASFGLLKSVATSTWGKIGPNVQTAVMRREESETAFRPSHLVTSQTISGVYVSIASLDIPPGEKIYGYALFPNDITASNDLINLTNFPTDTSGASGEGGLDLMAGGGIFMLNSLTTVSGTLYEDTDGDKNLGGTEPKLPANISVNLLDTNNNIITTTNTDNNGNYTFTGVSNGTYKIQVDTTDTDIPSGYTLRTPNDLSVTVSGSAVTNQNFGFDKPSANRPLGSPFTCNATFYITIGNTGGPQQLYDLNRSGSTFTFDPRGSATDTSGGYPAKFDYNALAYNPVDNYLYAYINSSAATSGPYSSGNVVKIGSDGVLHSLGKPTNNNNDTLSGGFFAATILSDGTYVIGGGGKFATIDLTTTPPTITNPQTTVSGLTFNDFAVDPKDPASLSGKRVYMVNENGTQDRLVILDLTTFPPQITSQATNPTGQNHNAGSQFVDAFGTLYYRSNTDNKLYRVNTDPNSPDYGKATEITTAPSGGNHDGASCLFATAMEKEVQDQDGNLITEIPAGETVKYVYKIATGNVLDLNGVTFTDDLRSVTGGSPINGKYTGNVSVSNGTGNVSFSNDNQTLAITNLTLPGQVVNQDTNGNPVLESLTITAEVTVPKTTTPGTYNNQSFLTNLPLQYPPSIPSDYPRSPAFEDPTPLDVTEAIATNPNVLLIKRITKINDGTTTNAGDNLATYNQEESNPYDDNKVEITELPQKREDPKPDTDKWVDTTSDTSSTFLIGGINGGKVKPDDEIEYTIYFLSAGDTEAKSVLVCDRVPSNVTFIPNSFNNQTQATAGSQNSDRGILWFKNGNTQSLTNVKDGDAAQYFPPGVEPSTVYPNIKCDGTNTNGAVVVNLENLPNATAPGTTGSYGFVRFRGKVK